MYSPDGLRALSASLDSTIRIWDLKRNIDQFAITNNRPDIILKRLGSIDQVLKDHYYYQYLRRLKRLGFQEQDIKQDYYVPNASILETKREDKFINLKFSLSDNSLYPGNYLLYPG